MEHSSFCDDVIGIMDSTNGRGPQIWPVVDRSIVPSGCSDLVRGTAVGGVHSGDLRNPSHLERPPLIGEVRVPKIDVAKIDYALEADRRLLR